MHVRQHLRLKDADPGSEPGGPGAPASPPAPPAPPALTKPEGLADEYWDAQSGVKFDALLPIVEQHNKRAETLITKPEDIDWDLGAIDPDSPDTIYEVDKDDPLLAEVSKIAVEEGASKPFMSRLAKAYAAFEVTKAKEMRAALVAEEAKLGDKVQERIAGAQAYVAGVVGKEKAERFRNTWVTAEQVEIIEALAKQAAGPTPADPNTQNGRAPGELPSDERERAKIWFSNEKKD